MNEPQSAPSVWNAVAEIAMQLQRRERTGLTRLYDITGPRLMRYAEALTKNRADAEDVLQTALVRIARKPEQFAYSERPWAYLVRVIRNESLKLVSRRRFKFSLPAMLQAWRASECPVEQAESRERIQDAVRKLPPEQAEVVVLKIWEDFTFAEIAELIGESPNTAASRYRYAMEKLSRSLHALASEHHLTTEVEVPHV